MTAADQLELCAREALAADFDAVPWDEAPEWRRLVAFEVARSALNSTSPDKARESWFNEMVRQGWRWDRALDEKAKTHPGIIAGELTRGGTKHWQNVVDRVRAIARRVGARMTGP
jgi:hypothetical protein